MSEIATDRMRKVKSILVTQEAPTDANSPYLKLAEKFNLKIDFRPFIQVEPVPVKEFRKQKIDILNHTAIIFTSRNAVDHFFHRHFHRPSADGYHHGLVRAYQPAF